MSRQIPTEPAGHTLLKFRSQSDPQASLQIEQIMNLCLISISPMAHVHVDDWTGGKTVCDLLPGASPCSNKVSFLGSLCEKTYKEALMLVNSFRGV